WPIARQRGCRWGLSRSALGRKSCFPTQGPRPHQKDEVPEQIMGGRSSPLCQAALASSSLALGASLFALGSCWRSRVARIAGLALAGGTFCWRSDLFLRRNLRQRFAWQIRRSTDIHAASAQLLLQAVEHGIGNQVTIELDCTYRVVISRNRIGDTIGVGVGIEHRDHRNGELVRLGNGKVFLVGIDDEKGVGQAA